MLQKLLIALCTIFVLSACGGDIDLGPDRVSSSPEPEPDDDGEDELPDPGDPDESQIWFYENFDAAGEEEPSPVDSWMERCAGECDASAELSLGASDGDNALSVAPEWASDGDDLEVYTSIEEIDDMTGGSASAWVNVPESYVADGNLNMHLFFTNANGSTARTRAFQATPGWNKLAIWSMEPGTGEPVEGEEPAEGEDAEIDYGSFGEHDENFTMEDINTVGVRFSANGKPVDVGGDLLVDNVLITQGSAFAPMLLDLTEGWFTKAAYNIEGDEANDPIYGDGFVALEATNPNQQLIKPVAGPGSYGGAEVVFTVSFDQAYVDSADGFQPFGQVFNDTDEGYADDEEVGGNWSCWTGMGDVTVDEELEVSCTMADEELFEIGEDQYVLFGVQSQTEGVTGTFRIHKVEIKGLNAEEDSGEVDLQSDDWAVLDAAEGVELQRDEEGGVYFEPSAEDEKLVYLLPGPADLVGGGFTMEFTVDQAFKDSGGDIQPIIQQNFGDFAGEFGCYIGNGELTADEPYTATCTTENEAMVSEEEGNTIRVGLQVKGSVEGRVTINSMTIDD